MRLPRSFLLYAVTIFSSAACTGPDAAPAMGHSSSGSAALALDTVRQAAMADTAAREARLLRLRTLTATLDDLASRDSLDLRVEVDIDARQVRVLDARSDTLVQYGIAVGSKEWPTREGEWTITQVVLNPEWIPPTDEAWAKEEKGSAPGDPDNPLGVAQLVYDLPRSIHGTNAPKSIGKAVSHGSIRATNNAVLVIAELLLQRTGVEGASAILQQARRERSTKVVIDLPKLVPIRVF